MIKETSVKIFLTSGVTITVKEGEELELVGVPNDLNGLIRQLADCLFQKIDVSFTASIPHTYRDEEGKEQTQMIKHYYHIPYDRVSWYLLEEV